MISKKEFAQKLKQYEKVVAKASKANLEARLLREELVEDCPHPSNYIEDYRWEHDNGYGVQNWRTGKQCYICKKKDRWNTGTFN